MGQTLFGRLPLETELAVEEVGRRGNYCCSTYSVRSFRLARGTMLPGRRAGRRRGMWAVVEP